MVVRTVENKITLGVKSQGSMCINSTRLRLGGTCHTRGFLYKRTTYMHLHTKRQASQALQNHSNMHVARQRNNV